MSSKFGKAKDSWLLQIYSNQACNNATNTRNLVRVKQFSFQIYRRPRSFRVFHGHFIHQPFFQTFSTYFSSFLLSCACTSGLFAMAALAKAIVVFSVMALIDVCFGTVYKVGDSLGWTNETRNVDYYKDWASNKTFYVGDSFCKLALLLLHVSICFFVN